MGKLKLKGTRIRVTEEQVGMMLNTWLDADEQDKSTEWLLQMMQDTAGVDLDTVLAFMEESPDGHVSKAVYWGDRTGEYVPPELRRAAAQEQRDLEKFNREQDPQ